MQNNELQAARALAEAGLEQYQDLFDFASVGYFTLTREGRVLTANLTGAAMLGTARSRLLRHGLGGFVVPEDLGRWDQHLLSVLRTLERQSCELGFRREDGSRFYARLESIRLDYPAPADRTGGPQQVYPERYEDRYGFFRPVIRETVYKYLGCGDLRQGFARVRCRDCGHEYLLAYSRCSCAKG